MCTNESREKLTAQLHVRFNWTEMFSVKCWMWYVSFCVYTSVLQVEFFVPYNVDPNSNWAYSVYPFWSYILLFKYIICIFFLAVPFHPPFNSPAFIFIICIHAETFLRLHFNEFSLSYLNLQYFSHWIEVSKKRECYKVTPCWYFNVFC